MGERRRQGEDVKNQRDSPEGSVERRAKTRRRQYHLGADRIEGVHQIVHNTTQGSPKFSQEIRRIVKWWLRLRNWWKRTRKLSMVFWWWRLWLVVVVMVVVDLRL